jgi:hypothetical protein
MKYASSANTDPRCAPSCLCCAAHASNLAALDVSADGNALIACGADSLARQTIVLWDTRNVRASGKVGMHVEWSKETLCL